MWPPPFDLIVAYVEHDVSCLKARIKPRRNCSLVLMSCHLGLDSHLREGSCREIIQTDINVPR